LRVLAYFATCFLVGCTPSESAVAPGACEPATPERAAMELDGGITAPADGGDVALPVYFLDISEDEVSSEMGLCTGTAVSSSTILTAAHCVKDFGNGTPMPNGKSIKLSGVRVCAQRRLDDRTACSQDVFYDSLFEGQDAKNDLAWVAFPVGTFTDYYSMPGFEAKLVDRFLAAGFGPILNDNGKPTLRYGITAFLANDDGKLETSRGQNFDNSSLIPGDSGGPLLLDCRMAGVASMYEGDRNEYVDLSKKRDLLRDSSGAVSSNTHVHFCGLSVVNNNDLQNRLCPPSGKHVSLHSIDEAKQHFPCGKAASSTNPNLPDDPSTSSSGSASKTEPSTETATPAACMTLK